MRALGRLFDINTGFAPVDTQTGANTGLRVRMNKAQGCTFVYYKAAGTGTDVSVLTLQEHNASTGGTSQNLAKITAVHKKTATVLDGSETWTLTTQAAAATYTNTGDATKQGIYVIHIDGASLSDGFTHLSMSVADTGSAGTQPGAMLYFLTDLEVQRKPESLANLLNG